MTLIGRATVFRCNFCDRELCQQGEGFPAGMKYLEAHVLKDLQVRHICQNCIAQERHGNEKLFDRGKEWKRKTTSVTTSPPESKTANRN